MNTGSMVRVISGKNALSFTSFGADAEKTFGNGMRCHPLLRSERFFELDRRQSYYECTNHDTKLYDFDGRVISNPRAAIPLISGEKAPFYVPLKMRRPSSPMRLAKVITDSFTNLLFGEDRFPIFRCEADADTEDFVNTIVKVGELPTKMIQLRNMGGSMGSVGMSWSWKDGRPNFAIHNAKHLFVHGWADRDRLLPRHVSEVYLYSDKDFWNGKEFTTQWWWHRRDWTPNADIVFKPCPFEEKIEPFWVPDVEKSYVHNDGVTHFEWFQNLPCEEPEGIPDYDGLYDVFESLDLLMSVVTRGATLNLDPTLILKMDAAQVAKMGIKKGSDNALVVGTEGDASYMELQGEGIKAGLDLVNAKRRFALETAQCVVPDPNEVAATGVSSVAIKAMYAPMVGKTNVLREQYGRGMKHVLEVMTEVARSNLSTPMFERQFDDDGNELKDDEGRPVLVPVQITLKLPPKVEKLDVPKPKPPPPKPPMNPMLPPDHPMQPKPDEEEDESSSNDEDTTIDPEDDPKGAAEQAKDKAEAQKPIVKTTERTPGKGEEVDPKWGAYFQATPDDLGKAATALQAANGGKAFVSQQTSTEWMAQFMGVDPNEEWKRVNSMSQQDQQHEKDMANPPTIGGAVQHPHQLPPGAKPKGPPGAPGAPPGAGGAPPMPKPGGPFGKPPDQDG